MHMISLQVITQVNTEMYEIRNLKKSTIIFHEEI